MPTKTYTETVERTVDVCDFCDKECGCHRPNRCACCNRLACFNHGTMDYEYLFYALGGWLCTECHKAGQACKDRIRILKESIETERKNWRKLGKEAANGENREK